MKTKELIFEEVKYRLKEQIVAVDQMTTKFNIILGSNSILATSIIITLLAVGLIITDFLKGDV